MSEFIYVKLIKKWGGFKVGDIVRFGTSKGEGRIAKGEGIKVEKQVAVNEPKRARGRPKSETATMKPKSETAEVTPTIEAKKFIKAKKVVKDKNKDVKVTVKKGD
ncbi:hypothetical protein LCGC14_1073830 [marine sediment metagenome]|uniref:Uncharacterized protein n=1 Tax=marine sediment metagenome TaxID=412755 RepID=A0A0F9N4S3_9ZZZZ